MCKCSVGHFPQYQLKYDAKFDDYSLQYCRFALGVRWNPELLRPLHPGKDEAQHYRATITVIWIRDTEQWVTHGQNWWTQTCDTGTTPATKETPRTVGAKPICLAIISFFRNFFSFMTFSKLEAGKWKKSGISTKFYKVVHTSSNENVLNGNNVGDNKKPWKNYRRGVTKARNFFPNYKSFCWFLPSAPGVRYEEPLYLFEPLPGGGFMPKTNDYNWRRQYVIFRKRDMSNKRAQLKRGSKTHSFAVLTLPSKIREAVAWFL